MTTLQIATGILRDAGASEDAKRLALAVVTEAGRRKSEARIEGVVLANPQRIDD